MLNPRTIPEGAVLHVGGAPVGSPDQVAEAWRLGGRRSVNSKPVDVSNLQPVVSQGKSYRLREHRKAGLAPRTWSQREDAATTSMTPSI